MCLNYSVTDLNNEYNYMWVFSNVKQIRSKLSTSLEVYNRAKWLSHSLEKII